MKDTIENSEEESNQLDPNLHELFLTTLADLYDAEKQLTQALPKMIDAAESGELRTALEEHLEETREHVTRLEAVAETLDDTLKQKTCTVMQALIKDASDTLAKQKGKSSLDDAIIAAGQKVEHFEIASYGTVIAWADELGHTEAVGLLEDTLTEEKATDEKLTLIAENLADEPE